MIAENREEVIEIAKTVVLESMQEEKDVVFMTEPKPQFVSLVKRGANQQPWVVVKSDAEGQMDMPRRILQAVVVPEGTDEAVIKSVVGDDVRLDESVKSVGGGYVRYSQVPREALKEGSFELVTLDAERKIQGLAGELIDEGSFVKKLFKPKVHAMELPEDVTKVDAEEVQKQFSDAVWDEMWRMEGAVGGILGQSFGEAGAKLGAVKMVLDNFYGFLESTFAVAKFDSDGLGEMPFNVLAQMQLIASEKANNRLTKARLEQLKSAYELIASIIKDVEGEPTEKADPELTGDEDEMKPEDVQKMIDESLKGVNDGLAQVTEAIKAITATAEKTNESLKIVSEEVSKLQKQPPITESHTTDDPVTKAVETEKSQDPYAGVFFRTA